ncbi:MAG: hypothetical protein AVDCRST_MAG68-3178 [uncultured Gemmatimonadetes bacterium]|uniref:Uncharacterized protein n=1 Tax=uncultured Gemmatimonadota bacterium TaxID=203437 RepID=A0A6J4LW95_9BACT|nr:MAG: hypothetical protein AVDCRST_MAG68-3178 [uncultured Gemmatimonadota bacterium]
MQRTDQGAGHPRVQLGRALLRRHQRQVVARGEALQLGGGVGGGARGRAVQGDAQREDVAGRGQRPVAADLLGRGVGGGERLAAHAGEMGARVRVVHLHLRHAVVQDHGVDPAPAHQEDVAGLHVAVHQPHAVPGREPLGRLAEDGRGLGRREHGVTGQAARQVLPLQQLHHQEVQPQRGVGAKVVHAHHVRMADARGGLRFAEEAGPRAPLGVVFHGDHLHGHGAVEAQVGGAEHGAHPAPAHHRVHAVAVAQGAAGEQNFESGHGGSAEGIVRGSNYCNLTQRHRGTETTSSLCLCASV